MKSLNFFGGGGGLFCFHGFNKLLQFFFSRDDTLAFFFLDHVLFMLVEQGEKVEVVGNVKD